MLPEWPPGTVTVLATAGEAPHAIPVEIEVYEVQDHNRPTLAIESGPRWRWTDPDADRRDAEVHAALASLANSISPAAAAPTLPDRDRRAPRA